MSILLWLSNLGGGASVGVQIFEQALLSRLQAIPEITAIVGTAIYTSALPQTHDLGALGPALTYSVPTKPRGHDLSGADGTAAAMVQLDAWSYSESSVKALIEAIFNGFNGTPTPTSWGNGTCQIMSCVQTNELDADESPEGGNDQPVFHTISEYSVRYRTALPELPASIGYGSSGFGDGGYGDPHDSFLIGFGVLGFGEFGFGEDS